MLVEAEGERDSCSNGIEHDSASYASGSTIQEPLSGSFDFFQLNGFGTMASTLFVFIFSQGLSLQNPVTTITGVFGDCSLKTPDNSCNLYLQGIITWCASNSFLMREEVKAHLKNIDTNKRGMVKRYS
jgi:hypothetical protein